MERILDLHIHSRYSRACSKALSFSSISRVCAEKGVDIVATGDFTHPEWFAAMRRELQESFPGSGFYVLKSNPEAPTKFILSSEVSLIYKDEIRARRLHLVLHAPNLEAVERLNKYLSDSGYNIRSDGRPILGIPAEKFVEICLGIDERFLVYPAHIWTPWFSVFGSKSGFSSLKECFRKQTKNIYAYETGLSSDPAMNWRVSALDNLLCLSNSDAHSLENIGREANAIDLEEDSYQAVYNLFSQRDKSRIKMTIEFYPEEGMYHFDGHDSCNFSCEPAQSRHFKNICPVCGKPLVIGVMNRIEELADRPEGFILPGAPSFSRLVELDKIIAEAFDIKSRKSKKVVAEYHRLIKAIGSELFILLKADLSLLAKHANPMIVEGIRRVRLGQLIIVPGFDGRYGEVKIFSSEEKSKKQALLF